MFAGGLWRGTRTRLAGDKAVKTASTAARLARTLANIALYSAPDSTLRFDKVAFAALLYLHVN